MKNINKLKLGFLSLLLLLSPVLSSTIANAADEPRAPPKARSAGTLGDQVMRSISRVSEYMSPEDEDDEPDLAAAKEELDELYERRYERMNDFEKSTTLGFYTNYYLAVDNLPEALRVFEQILTDIEDLREGTRLRALRSLGQLNGAEENWADSVKYYDQWRELSFDENDIVFRGLAYAHFQLEQFAASEPHWLSFMQMKEDKGEELPRSDYSFLNGLYFNMEDYDNALNVTRNMVVMFDDSRDWRNLMAIYSNLEDDNARLFTLALSYVKGYFERDTEYLNLGQSLAGEEAPFSGALIFNRGIEQNIVEEDEDNLTSLTQMYMISNDYRLALGPATKAAELSDSGDGYDTVGYIHYVLHDYQSSADAFQAAVDKGGLNDPAATYLFLARALFELDEYDAASAATSKSGEAGDANNQRAARNYQNFITGNKDYSAKLAANRQDAIDFYRSYPSLQ